MALTPTVRNPSMSGKSMRDTSGFNQSRFMSHTSSSVELDFEKMGFKHIVEQMVHLDFGSDARVINPRSTAYDQLM